MAVLSLILGILGGLCTVMGILTALEVAPLIGAAFTAIFWLMLAVIMFVAAITCLVAQARFE